MHSDLPIYLDGMDDHAWTTLGGAPNLGLLLTGNRRVLVRQAWFDAAEIKEAILAQLGTELEPGQEGEWGRKQAEAVAADHRLVAAFAATGIAVDEILKPFADGDADAARQRLAAFPALATYTSRHQERRGRGEEDTAWRLAIRGRQPAVVAALLDAGVSPDTEDALHVAAQNGNIALLDQLLARGAAVDGRSADEVTALDDAAYSGQRTCAERLLAAKASKSLHAAASLGDLAYVEGLIARDPSRVHLPDGKRRTPLMYAAANGQLAVAKLLVAHGANPGRKIGHVETPLTLAVDRSDAELVRLLLKYKADPMLQPSGSGNSLHHAARAGNAAIMRLLLETWADPYVFDYGSDTTPFLYAAAYADPDTLAVLVEYGAHATAVTGYLHGGCAPPFPYLENALHLAVMHGRLDNVRFLATQGVNPNGRNHSDQTPLHLAACLDDDLRQQQIPMLETLLAVGANINRLDSQGLTCLDLAVATNSEAAVVFLRSRGAKLATELPKGDSSEQSPSVNFFLPNELVPEEEGGAPRPPL